LHQSPHEVERTSVGYFLRDLESFSGVNPGISWGARGKKRQSWPYKSICTTSYMRPMRSPSTRTRVVIYHDMARGTSCEPAEADGEPRINIVRIFGLPRKVNRAHRCFKPVRTSMAASCPKPHLLPCTPSIKRLVSMSTGVCPVTYASLRDVYTTSRG